MAIANSPEMLKLPGSVFSTGDPSPGNPFERGSRCHLLWEEATHHAAIREGRLKSVMSKRAHMAANLDEQMGWLIKLVVLKFDIWAKRGLTVVFCNDDMRSFEEWLIGYAEGWLVLINQTYREFLGLEELLRRLRLRLIGRVEHWKAEARQRVYEHQKNGEQSGDDEATSVAQILCDAAARQGLRAPDLAQKVRKRLNPALKLKADRTTIYRILSGETTNPKPAIKNALIDALQLEGEQAEIVRTGLSAAKKK